MTITLNGTSGIVNDATSLSYTGTLTGGTGVVNLGSGQVYKDASGNVGIGTSSPNAKVEILKTSSGAVVTQLFLHNASDADGTGARLDFAGLTDGTIPTGSISNIRTGAGAYALTFNNFGGGSNTERARIDSSGNLLLSTARSSARGLLDVPQPGGSGSVPMAISRWGDAGAMVNFYSTNATTTLIGSISNSGNTNTAYNTSSDYRLKDNITPMTGALAKVALLKPCTYKWKVDGSDGQGFIAHELAEVEAGCVTGEKDAVDADGNPQYQGIDTSFLVATLAAAIQEQQTLITALNERLTALEAPIV